MTDIWAPLHYQDINWMKTTKSVTGLQIMLFLFENRERSSFTKIGPYSVMWWLCQCYILSMERATWSSPSILPSFAETPLSYWSIFELFGCLLNLLKLSKRSKSCWLDYWQRDTAGFPQEVRLIRLFKRNPKWIRFYFQFALYETKSNGYRIKSFSPFMILLSSLLS